MVLMFLRELVEQLPLYPQFQQTYGCPMMKCYAKFNEPFPLIQHLLSCPELPNGEFDCDKCNNWHEFPTNEKDWSSWTGWSWKSQRQNAPQAQGDNIQRKRSLGSKMRDTFLRKRDPSRKSMDQPFAPDTRPGTATSGASSVITTLSRCAEHQHLPYPGHANPAQTFADLQKSVVSTNAPQIDSRMFWPGMGNDPMTDLQSAVSSIAPSISSIAPSSTYDTETTKDMSANTSQTTLFTPSLASYQSPTPDVLTPRYMFSPHSAFDSGSAPLGGQAPSESAMSIDEPLTDDAALSPTELRPATPTDSRTWWGPKPDIDTPRPTPASSPFYVMEHPSLMHHPMSRTLSQESMNTAISGLYHQRSISESTQMDAMSPHSEHGHHHVHHQGGMGMPGRAGSPTEDLVCDECQWKPRGVRENLRGYLRKHKNTHKGLRLPCDVVGCTKTFSRLDNLKKHKKDKHGIDEPGGIVPLRRVAEEYEDNIDEDSAEQRPQGLSEADLRSVSGDYSMLWPALHF